MSETVNIKKSYSGLNEKLAKLFDESGVRRSFTVPYIEGQEMKDHINAVGQAASQSGGLATNFVTSAHHAQGKGYGSGDGHTLGHPSEKLRQTIIPKDDARAKETIDAAQKLLNNFKHLLGDDNSAVQTSQGQLDLVKPTSGAGMSLMDFGVLVINIMHKPTQLIAQAHNGTKDGGHQPTLRAPGGQESQPQAQGDAQAAPDASTDQEQAPEAQGAPEAAAPAPQAQG